jgi:hypothetical protein
MSSKLQLIIVLVFSAGWSVLAKQHYGIRGKLMCGSTPASNVQILMYDEDTGMI